jgi:hypothetical protein
MSDRPQPDRPGDDEEIQLTDEQIVALFWLPEIDSGKHAIRPETIDELLALGVIAHNGDALELTERGRQLVFRLLKDKEA